MKSLQLAKPHLIVMVGVPGAGKSFFADHFAETFHAPIVSWNTIRNELFNKPSYSKDEDVIVERVALLQLAQLFKTGSTIVFEGNSLTQTARQDLARLARDAGYDTLFTWVQVDHATARARALKHGIPATIHDAAAKRFTPLKDTDNHVVISGKHTYASQLKIVLRRLSGDRTGQPVAPPMRATPQQRSSTSIIIR